MKPSCTRCVLLLDKCLYQSATRSAAKHQKDEIALPTPSCSILSLSPGPSPYSKRSPSFEILSTQSTPEFVEANSLSNSVDAPKGLSDTDLYHHYLQHTSRTLTHCQRDQTALQIGMPTLASQSKTVFHSLLAVAAACLGCDMISKEPPPDINTVTQVLITGYRHYNSASERMRESISWPGDSKLEPVLASALILMPFATASQQINHWISGRSETQECLKSLKLLSTTPRDVIIIMRGIRTTLQTLGCVGLGPNLEPSLETEYAFDSYSALPEVNTRPAALTSSRAHVMTPILAATSQGAFSKLQKRLESAFLCSSDGPDDSLSACSAAFEILKDLRSKTFSASNLSSSSSSLNSPVKEFSERETLSISQVASWLRSFASGFVIPLPTEPLTRFFLTFLVQAPQEYLDLVLPLLDQRLESPIDATSDEISAELTTEKALGLDIYAHWSVLMFLVEEESWWIGNLPVVTLSGMVNRYGDNFVTRLWPESSPGQEQQWWPGSMLNILREVKRYR